MLGDGRSRRCAAEALTERDALGGRAPAPTPEEAVARGPGDPAPRAVPDRGRATCSGSIDVADVGAGLSRLTDATLEATLDGRRPRGRGRRGRGAAADPDGDRGDGPLRRLRAVLRQRRRRDVRARPAAGRRRAGARRRTPTAVANELRRLLALPGHATRRWRSTPTCGPRASRGRWCARWSPTPPTTRKWSKVWEAQALLRADAVVGDVDLRGAVHRADRPAALPGRRAHARTTCVEVRRIKARVDDERLPRGADPTTHLKLGRGGLADIEWTVQLLQMRHAGAGRGPAHHPHPGGAGGGGRGRPARRSRTPRRSPHAWRTVSRTAQRDHAGARQAGRPAAPRPARAGRGGAASCGYPPGESDRLVNDYLRITRRAHAVVERVFWE